MVNYRRAVCEVVVLGALLALATAAPAHDCTHTHYDQRQNGSENYRVNIDGIVVAVAPAETLVSALGDMDDLMELLALEEDFDFKPKPPPSSASPSPAVQIMPVSLGAEKPILSKPEDKPQESKPQEEKPQEDKPQEEKPAEQKPQEDKPVVPKPQEEKPEVSKPEMASLSDISMDDDMKIQKKEVAAKKQEKAKRLKNRLAAFLLPLLRKNRHH